MSYVALAEEYLQTANMLKQRIRTLKHQSSQSIGEELYVLEQRVTLLQSEYYDLLSNAAMISGYGDRFG